MTKITPDIKAAVIRWLDDTETRQQLASRLGISLGSVDRILLNERVRRAAESAHASIQRLTVAG
jgi:hypothetical protein